MCRRIAAIFISFLIAISAASQDRLMYQLPGMSKVRIREHVPFTTIGDTTLSFDIYYPERSNNKEPLPLVIFNNGVGVMDMPAWGQYKEWCRLIAASGMIAIIHQARPGNSLKDGEALVDYMVGHAGELGVDPAKIGLWTCSANSRVSSRIAFKTRPNIIKAFVIYYGATDSLGALRQDLPTLIVRAGLDAQFLNINLDNFIQNCLIQDIRFDFINYLNGIHAFDIFTDTDECREIIKTTVAFLRNKLNGPVISKEFVLTNRNFMWLITNNQLPVAFAEFRKARTRYRADSTFQPFFNGVIRESVLNANGYWLLEHQRVPDALEVFKLAVESYPSSPNAYESLSEAWELSGNKGEAVRNAAISLEKLSEATIDSTIKQRIRASAEGRLARLR